MQQWTVIKTESGMRLQEFLRLKTDPAISAKQLKRSIEAGNSLINGKVERFASKPVGIGDIITLHPVSTSLKQDALTFDPQRVLYTDAAVLVYNKPAAIASDSSTFLATVRAAYPNATLTHRLDRDTTGALIFALTPSAHEKLLELFRFRKVQKTYYALIDGILTNTRGCIENHLGKLHSYQGQSLWGAVSASKGCLAITRWEVKIRGKSGTLVACYPATGRTHQIRVHLNDLGHPILGDYQYGKQFTCKYRASRVLLHAFEVAFEHPTTHCELRVSAPLPPDFITAAEQVLGKILQ
jgi:RluA family pseudouridine synthase